MLKYLLVVKAGFPALLIFFDAYSFIVVLPGALLVVVIVLVYDVVLLDGLYVSYNLDGATV